MSQETALWERREGEPTRAWEAFRAYRDLPPGVRSTAKVAQDAGKGKRLLDRWCTTYSWVKRAAAWDAERDRIGKLAELEAIAKSRQEEVEAISKMRVRHIETSMALQALGRSELRKWIRRIEAAGPDSKPVLDPRELRQLIESGIKLERLTRGEPDSIQEQQDATTAAEKRRLMRPLLSDPEAEKAIATLNDIALRGEDASGGE